MQRFKFLSVLLGLPLIVALLTVAGCGGGEGDVVTPKKQRPVAKKDGPTTETTKAVPLEAKEYGTLSGTVTLDGDLPAMPKQEFSGDNKATCAMGSEWELIQQTWLVNKENKGVANVVIFLKAPDGKFFRLKDGDEKRSDTVVVDQPHCAFMPHVVALFPQYTDPATGELKPTGQVFRVKNSAPFSHNTGIQPNDESVNSKANFIIPSGTHKDLSLNPDPNGPIGFKCDIHPWMSAKGWVFDHPYAAVTDKDGKYEIKNVPVGVKLNIVGWHEGAGYFHGGNNGTEATLEAKKELNLKLKAK